MEINRDVSFYLSNIKSSKEYFTSSNDPLNSVRSDRLSTTNKKFEKIETSPEQTQNKLRFSEFDQIVSYVLARSQSMYETMK